MDAATLRKLRDLQVAAFAAQTQLEMGLSTTAEPAHDFDRDDLPAAFAKKEAEVGAVLRLAADVSAALAAAIERPGQSVASGEATGGTVPAVEIPASQKSAAGHAGSKR